MQHAISLKSDKQVMPDTQASNTSNTDNASVDVDPETKLSAEDLQRVERYLSSPVHSVERKPFRPWFMMLMLLVTVGSLSLLSLLIAWLVLE